MGLLPDYFSKGGLSTVTDEFVTYPAYWTVTYDAPKKPRKSYPESDKFQERLKRSRRWHKSMPWAGRVLVSY